MNSKFLGKLNNEERKHFFKFKKRCTDEGKPMVLWGWKRDEIVNKIRKPNSRTVYFSADLDIDKHSNVFIKRAYFFLETRAKDSEISDIVKQVGKPEPVSEYKFEVSNWSDPNYEGYSRFSMSVGDPNKYDLESVQRRLKGKPRVTIPKPRLVKESTNYDLSKYTPFAVCVGSGLSAESGLPLLGTIHDIFEVDNMETGKLVFGSDDNLPGRIAKDVLFEFNNFCRFTIEAVKAVPSESHFTLSDMYKKGIIRQVFTDNMDDILGKVGVPYTKTRLSIFPDRYPAKFDMKVKSLLCIGVAVDRRDVIKQARANGLKIISINPVFGVAPHSRNMDYLCKGDIFYKETACVALPKIIQMSGF